jgi:predicted lipid-binding transport protein (Tim44 family)
MGSSGGFPIDLVLFGMIAAFLVLRLRSILGRRTGFERRAQTYARPVAAAPDVGAPVIDGTAEPAPSTRALPDAASPAGQALARMRAVAANFDPAHFLAGAEVAFRMVVEAFAAGNRETLKPLLSEETYRGFDAVLAAREANGETQRTDISGIESAAIEAADLRGTVASITVRFVSDQTNLTLDKSGRVIAGTDAVTEITDIWTFERDLHSTDPTWRLVAARSA